MNEPWYLIIHRNDTDAAPEIYKGPNQNDLVAYLGTLPDWSENSIHVDTQTSADGSVVHYELSKFGSNDYLVQYTANPTDTHYTMCWLIDQITYYLNIRCQAIPEHMIKGMYCEETSDPKYPNYLQEYQLIMQWEDAQAKAQISEQDEGFDQALQHALECAVNLEAEHRTPNISLEQACNRYGGEFTKLYDRLTDPDNAPEPTRYEFTDISSQATRIVGYQVAVSQRISLPASVLKRSWGDLKGYQTYAQLGLGLNRYPDTTACIVYAYLYYLPESDGFMFVLTARTSDEDVDNARLEILKTDVNSLAKIKDRIGTSVPARRFLDKLNIEYWTVYK